MLLGDFKPPDFGQFAYWVLHLSPTPLPTVRSRPLAVTNKATLYERLSNVSPGPSALTIPI